MSLGLVSIVAIAVSALLCLAFARLFIPLLFSLFRRSGEQGVGGHSGYVTLNCPHCQQLTRADRHICEHCNRDL